MVKAWPIISENLLRSTTAAAKLEASLYAVVAMNVRGTPSQIVLMYINSLRPSDACMRQ